MAGKIVVANSLTLLCTWRNTYVEVWRSDAAAEKTTITCLAASTLSGGEYFTLSSPDNNYYVWFKVDGVGVDPLVADAQGLQISLLSAETAVQVAVKVQTVLRDKADFLATLSSADVTVSCIQKGAATDAAEGSVATGFTFTSVDDGSGDLFKGVPFTDVIEVLDINIADDGSAEFLCLEQQVLTEEMRDRANPNKYTKTSLVPVLKTQPAGWVDLT